VSGAVQRLRVLAALRGRGPRGVRQADFLDPVIDGEGRITRLSARIGELRDRGHVIEATMDGPAARYVLIDRQLGPRRVSGTPSSKRPRAQAAPASPAKPPGLKYRPPCPYDRHRPTDWQTSPEHAVTCGVCHPPVPGITVIRVGPGGGA